MRAFELAVAKDAAHAVALLAERALAHAPGAREVHGERVGGERAHPRARGGVLLSRPEGDRLHREDPDDHVRQREQQLRKDLATIGTKPD